jgi:hypothetical protein
MIQVGTKLVCIDASNSTCLRVDQIYTCLAVEEAEFVGVDCCSAHQSNVAHCGWYRRRFCPAVERKTSIEVFKKMLENDFKKMLKPQGVASND